VAALLLLLAACAAGQPLPDVALEEVASGFERPLGVVTDGVSERLYVLEKGGAVRVVEDGQVRSAPFLDLRDRVSTRSERGLLGLAFAPVPAGGAGPTEVFVHYSDLDGDTVLLRAPLTDGRPDLAEATVMLRQEQPYPNHNGGELAFGPDGMLYLGLGDGGSGGDPLRAGQDTTTLLGKLLRLDVSASPYAIPDDNPFAQGGGEPEIWALGLRNPWRFSFDPPTGDLWIADVGQNRTEEVNRLAGNRPAGADFGWSTLEGDRCFRQEGCDRSGAVPPLATYDHDEGLGQSVTGGYVYRGEALPALQGAYVFGDFVGGTVMAVRAGDPQVRLLARPNVAIASFGVDPDGELLVVDFGGRLLRITPR
jgi:glucose/arabinose dehydrogenase